MAFDAEKFKAMTLNKKIAYIGFKDEEDLKSFIIKTLTDTFIANPKYCKSRALATIVRDAIKTIPGWYYLRLSGAILFARNFFKEEYEGFLDVVQLQVLQKRGEIQQACSMNGSLKSKESQISAAFAEVIDFIFSLRHNKDIYFMIEETAKERIEVFLASPNANNESRKNTRKRSNSTVSVNSVAETGPIGAGVGPMPPLESEAATRPRSRSGSKSTSKSRSGSKSSTQEPVPVAAEKPAPSPTRRRSTSNSNSHEKRSKYKKPSRVYKWSPNRNVPLNNLEEIPNTPAQIKARAVKPEKAEKAEKANASEKPASSPTRRRSRSNSNSHKKKSRSKKPSRVYKWSPNRTVPLNNLEDIPNTPAQIKARVVKAEKAAAKAAAAAAAAVAAKKEKNARLLNAIAAAERGITFATIRRKTASRLQKEARHAAKMNNFRRAHEEPTLNVRLANPDKFPTY